MRKLRLILVGN